MPLLQLQEVAVMAAKYIIPLTPEEKSQLEALTTKRNQERRPVLLARALLLSDATLI
jgi:hypothetical protein